jgi:polysaccharide export outer membrane protein
MELGGGDQIRIITYGEDQLTGEFRVQAAGGTPVQLNATIANELRQRKLLRDPGVAVEAIAYRPVFVLGEVAKPGQSPYQPRMMLLTTGAVAGGLTYRGVRDYASAARTTDNHAVEGKVTPPSFVAPGDVVNALERRF